MDDIQESLLGDTQPVPRQNMGLGKLGDPTIVFVRQFRWTLSSKILDEHFIKNVKFDFKNQKVYFEAYEIVHKNAINIHDWLESDLSKETLFFTTYDGCGMPIYTYELSSLIIESDTAVYDYSKSDEVTRMIIVSYEDIKNVFHSKKKEVYKKRFDWKMSVDGGEPVKIKITQRPKLNVEETEINFLNVKTWIPGKANWEDIHVELDQSSRCLLHPLISKDSSKVQLHLFDLCGNLLETWFLKNVRVFKMLEVSEKICLTLKYDEVSYESAHKAEVSTVTDHGGPNV